MEKIKVPDSLPLRLDFKRDNYVDIGNKTDNDGAFASIRNRKDYHVARIWQDCSEAGIYAAYLVHAANNYPALVKALGAFTEAYAEGPDAEAAMHVAYQNALELLDKLGGS